MQYQIQTLPIWDAYRTEKDCPLCKLHADREKRLVGQYLAENVMDPDFRTASNAVGFCPEHIRMMFDGQNKLGLALQLETRTAAVRDLLKKPAADKKSAKKLALNLRDHIGCVICSALGEPMERYYMTIAQMYDNEREFPELFGEAHHCLEHATHLIAAACYAKTKTAQYLSALTGGLSRDLGRTEAELRAFADCFDFRNSGTKPDATAIPRAIKLLITNK